MAFVPFITGVIRECAFVSPDLFVKVRKTFIPLKFQCAEVNSHDVPYTSPLYFIKEYSHECVEM